MNHFHRGKAIIFNHQYFDESLGLNDRMGSDVDTNNLKLILTNLEFEVKVYNDKSYNKIKNILEKLSKEDHSNSDCILLVVLSHGDSEILYAEDTVYPRSKLWRYFTDENCPTLKGKPKIFFIQACQGNKFDSGIQLQNNNR